MAQAIAGAGLPEHLAAIAVAVDPLDHDAVAGKPGDRVLQEGGGGFLALVWQDFAVGKPASVVDADMQALPTDPVMPIDRTSAAPSDTMGDACDPPELLGVEVQQLARARPLVAQDWHGRVDRLEVIETEPAQDLCHGQVWHAELPRDRGRAHRVSAPVFDLGNALRWRTAQAREPGAAIQQRDLAAAPPVPHPFAHGLLADAEIGRHFDGSLTSTNAASHQESTVWSGARIDLPPEKWTPGYAYFASACRGVM